MMKKMESMLWGHQHGMGDRASLFIHHVIICQAISISFVVVDALKDFKCAWVYLVLHNTLQTKDSTKTSEQKRTVLLFSME